MKTLLSGAFLILHFLLFTGENNTGKQPVQEFYADSSSFDFWIGLWELTWMDGSGANEVTKILKGNVVQEQFQADSGKFAGFKGMSVSTFDKKTGLWRQTWVDSNGSYLDFEGGMNGKRMILRRTATTENDGTFYQRMVFYNIKSNSFDWNWEKSDDGEKWQLLWHIHYERKPGSVGK